MKKYTVVSICEREVSELTVYDDHSTAFLEMLKGFERVLKYRLNDTEVEEIRSSIIAGEEEISDYEIFGINHNSAWINDGPNHDNYDWFIKEINI